MIRTLLTTTALVALLSTGALAQDSAPATPPATPPADNAMPPVGGIDGAETFILSQGYTPADNDSLASRIMGTQVYTGTGDDAEAIGDINDLVLDSDGSIAAVIVGVGGFLGVGEKNVAVPYSDLQWSTDADGNNRAVMATTKDDLATAPDFIWPPDASEATPPLGDNDAGGAMAPAPDADGPPPCPAGSPSTASTGRCWRFPCAASPGTSWARQRSSCTRSGASCTGCRVSRGGVATSRRATSS